MTNLNKEVWTRILNRIRREMEDDCDEHPGDCDCPVCEAIDAMIDAIWHLDRSQGKKPDLGPEFFTRPSGDEPINITDGVPSEEHIRKMRGG